MSIASNIQKNLFDMLIDRKYSLIIESIRAPSFAIRDMLLVEFINLNIVKIDEVLMRLKNYKIEHVLLIFKEPIPGRIRTKLEALDFSVEWMDETELSYNPTKHIYVPQHRLLSNEEKSAVLLKYNITEKEMPRISTTDRICRYYRGLKGQIFEIIRKEKNGESFYYRIVD